VAAGGFGLLPQASEDNNLVQVAPGGGFFSVDDADPKVPDLSVPAPSPTSGPQSPPQNTETQSVNQAPSLSMPAKCAPLHSDVEPVERRNGVPPEVYDLETPMEHPAIAGLMLSKAERTYGALLEIIDHGGVIRHETLDEKRYRLKWKRPIPAADTATKKNFVALNPKNFGPTS
jgi:hypothetical protein